MTDPIADYLTRLRNAIQANHRVVEIPASNLKKNITKILFEKGYILNYMFEDKGPQGIIKVALKYDVATKSNAIKICSVYLNQAYVSIQVIRICREL